MKVSNAEIGSLERDREEIDRKIKAICEEILPGWSDLAENEFEITVISGGISNALYKVIPILSEASRNLHGNFDPVAFRIYGFGTEKFIDRAKELELMQITHAHGFGPRLLGLFKDGRIEEFLDKRSLSPEEMSDPLYVPHIAAALARFHAIDATEVLGGCRSGDDMKGSEMACTTPFGRIREWLDLVSTLDFSDDPMKAKAVSEFSFEDMREEVNKVERVAQALKSPIVFCHNDLLSGNIMINQNDDRDRRSASQGGTSRPTEDWITFIDFEYAAMAPRGYDWGNHFNEYAGFECDYSRYPEKDAAGRFIRSYLAASRRVLPEDVKDSEVDKAIVEANLFALASHQYWGTWSLMQAKWSSIEFDYVGYAALRWKEYEKRKEEFLEGALEHISERH